MATGRRVKTSRAQGVQSELTKISKRFENLETENAKLHEKIKRLEQENNTLTNTLDNYTILHSEVETLKKYKESLERRVVILNDQIQELRQRESKYKKYIGDSEKREQHLKSQCVKAETQLRDLNQEMEKERHRKLPDEKKNIPELSDKNRPSKLGERYSELYDNQWTEAYDKFEKQGMAEKEAMSVLIQILRDVYNYCQKKSDKQMESIKRAMFMKDMRSRTEKSALKLKTYKDCRKEEGEESGKAVLEEYLAYLKRRYTLEATKALRVQPYVEECVQLCWLMCLQDPPVVFDVPRGRGEALDGDMYRAYTKTGKKIEFLVWPTMLLHKDGNVLCKGVAQGYDPLKQDYLDREIKRKEGWKEHNPSSERNEYALTNAHLSKEFQQSGSAHFTRFYEPSRYKAHNVESNYRRFDDKDHVNLGFQPLSSTDPCKSNIYGITDKDMDDFFYYRKRWSHDIARNLMGKERYDRCREYYYKS